MDQNAKAKFILALHKHSLQAFDAGGPVGAAPMTGGGGASGAQTTGGPMGMLTVQNGYNAQQAPTQNTNYGDVIQQASGNALAGYGQAQNIQSQQQRLADQLQLQSQGGGPNPAQAALAQSTGQNVANQAALMAGQRGASSNPALMARQAAMQGAATQQQAVGQGATLQAQQQIAAQQQLAAQQQAMASGNIAEQGAQSQLFGTSAGAQNTQNANNIQNAGMAQGINAQVSQNNANAGNKVLGGIEGAAAGLAAGPIKSLFAKGGEVPDHLHAMAKIYHPHMYAGGGDVYGAIATPYAPSFSNAQALTDPTAPADKQKSPSSDPLSGGGTQTLAGGPMDAMGGEASGGGMAELALLAAKGGKIPGKGKVKGNSTKNDDVPALLSPQEIVLPRSVTMHKDAPQKAAEFVRMTLAKRGLRGKAAA